MHATDCGEAAHPYFDPAMLSIGLADPLRSGPGDADRRPQLVGDELNRILASTDFEASERNRRFLTYVVEEVLAGRASRIKAYNIATTVFGRDANFDPQTDAIVRIEARRLRRALEHYYLTGGKDDPIRICIPKGTYSARFDARAAHDAKEAERKEATVPTRRFRSPTILVSCFEADGVRRDADNMARSFTRQLLVSLTRFTELAVYGPGEAARGLIQGESAIDYVLKGGMTISGDRFAVDALLVDARSGRNLWAGTFERTAGPDAFIGARDEVVGEITGIVAQPFGVIYGALVPDTGGGKGAWDEPAPQECVALFYRWRHAGGPELRERVRAGLERAIIDAPECAEAFACLSMLFSDAPNHDLASLDRDAFTRARALAKRAVELAPYSSRARQGLALAHWALGDTSGCIEELGIALSLNPNDVAILAELGLRKALLGEWDEAVPMLEQAFARCSALRSGEYRIGLALHHLVHDRPEAALAEARRIGVQSLLVRIIEAAAGAGLHRRHGLTESEVLMHLHGLKLHPTLIQQIRLRLDFEQVSQ